MVEGSIETGAAGERRKAAVAGAVRARLPAPQSSLELELGLQTARMTVWIERGSAALEPLATRPGHLVDGAPKELSSYTPFAPSVGVAGRLHPSVGKREDPARGRRRSIAARCALAYGSTVSVRCAVCVLAARIGRFDRYRHHHDHHLHQHGAAGAALAVRELYERLQPALGALRVLCCAPVTLPTTYDGAVCSGCVVSSDFDVCCDVSYPAWRSGS